MSRTILGIHHVTAIAGDPQRNVDFYVGLLGLRLVKLTVNFDDPFTHHLYYGDAAGSPGTILTFFPWAGIPRGRAGNGQVVRTAFSVPKDSLRFWVERLRAKGVNVLESPPRFGEPVASFEDPDGLGLELIASATPGPGVVDDAGLVPAGAAIQGFHSATLAENAFEDTAELLTKTMGWRAAGEEGARRRFLIADGGPSRIVDVVEAPGDPAERMGSGTVHHIAWRTPNDASQEAWRHTIAELHVNVSPIMERQYFRSIYFREPGGVLFEIATDTPGFAVDEPAGELGRSLKLPPWMESSREEIEARLPRLVIPGCEPSRRA